MPLEHANEAQRLAEHYREMYDGELLRLAGEIDGLTDIAKQALRNEMELRGLNRPAAAPRPSTISGSDRLLPPVENSSDEDGPPQDEFTWMTKLCDCDTREQAWQLREVLRRAGIDSRLEVPARYAIDRTHPRILVAADQLDQALEISAKPIPQDVIDESKMEIPEYAVPTCPRCGAADPILENVEPSNEWSCEACGAQWKDPVSPESDPREPAV